MASKLVVAVDGSSESRRAVDWCAKNALLLGLDVVAVQALEVPIYPAAGQLGPMIMGPVFTDADRQEIRDTMKNDWCKPLSDAGVNFEVALATGYPATVIQQVAEQHNASLVVAGRRVADHA